MALSVPHNSFTSTTRFVYTPAIEEKKRSTLASWDFYLILKIYLLLTFGNNGSTHKDYKIAYI